ncbi:MAG: hypothetical protein M3Q31_05110 [Actinomycetota bacterium]|nr:hypothetical protein [Actinomycetota bacterium]
MTQLTATATATRAAVSASDARTTSRRRELDASARPPLASLADMLRRLGRAIAAPPAHPMWSTPDATAQASLLPSGERERLLSQGRLAPRA